jgi:uncharacterized membrane protein YdjX (TVP38/TMEM64 family)
LADYLILFAIVLGVNLMPAFGPPTWSIIVVYGLNTTMPLPGLVISGAVAAALGRFLLAHAFRFLRGHIPARMKRNVEAAGRALERRKRHTILALGLFALSPVPSAQLFEAAGLTGIRLLPFTGAFFAGRLVSYSIYGLTAKSIEATTLGGAFRHSLVSPLGIGIQIAMIAVLVGLTQIDWEKHFGGGPAKGN